jgi:tRNA G10  N-methylase Trm11
MEQKMLLSAQKLDFEKEIAEITKKFTSMIRDMEDKNFAKQHDLKSENSFLNQKDLENGKRIELLLNEHDLLKNELHLFE